MSTKPFSRRQSLAALVGACVMQPAAAGPLLHATRPLFGSPAEMLLTRDAEPLTVAAVWSGLTAMNERWNAWKPKGLGPLNQALREGRSVKVDPSLRALIDGAARLEVLSDGLFNAGLGGLVQAWGFHDDVLAPGPRPAAHTLARWRQPLPSLAQLQWRGLDVRSPNPALQLDFGGYAKGVAVDWALDQLQAAGVHGAVVDLGGNLATLGNAGDRPWQVGLRDPLGSGVMAQLATGEREAVITSGVYERFRELDGQRCGPVLDPQTGQPTQGLLAATVVHRDAGLADAAATALMVAGPARWVAVAERMGLDQVLVVHHAGLAQVTPRLAARLQVAPDWQKALSVI
jgi:thiamine biosynthesis lipoprotein